MISKAVKIKHLLRDSKRFDGRYFLNSDALLSLIMMENEDKCLPLSECAIAFNPPVFKRQFCQNTEKAVQYFQSSDVPAGKERSDVYINKAQAKRINARVKENQILITGFGTVGNVRLVSRLQAGVAFANNVCRVETKENHKHGFIYAFLASKYGRAQMNKNASGSVVRYIESPGIKKTLVPILSNDKQQKIHNLITNSAEKRLEANLFLEEAIDSFDNKLILHENRENEYEKININQLSSRFDATYVINSNKIKAICDQTSNVKFIPIIKIADDIFIGPRSKRNYTKYGTPFLSGAELQKSNPTKVEKYLNPKDASPFIVKEGWILITRSGTIGNVSIILPCLNGYAATDDAIRITLKADSEISPLYLFAFLNSKLGKKSIVTGSFGSVIQHINEDYIGSLLVPVFSEAEIRKVSDNIFRYINLMNSAILQENQAIKLVEKEIEQWQQ